MSTEVLFVPINVKETKIEGTIEACELFLKSDDNSQPCKTKRLLRLIALKAILDINLV